MVVLEQFRNIFPDLIATYRNEKNLATASTASALADEFVLLHEGKFKEGTAARSELGGRGNSGATAVDQMRSQKAGPTKFDFRPRGNFDKSKTCNYCHETGHWKVECLVLQSRQGGKAHVKPAAAAVPTVSSVAGLPSPAVGDAEVRAAYAPFI